MKKSDYECVMGLDVSQQGVEYQLQNAAGARLAGGQAPKSAAGFGALREVLQAHKAAPAQTLVVLEATGRDARR